MRSIDNLIGSNATLRQLGARLADRDALLRRVRRALPDEIAPHCLAADADGRELRLLASSAVWATRLRYLARDLLRDLRADGLGVTTVEVRVLPPDARTGQRATRILRHSEGAALCLDQTAEGIEDPALRAALQRLGSRLRR